MTAYVYDFAGARPSIATLKAHGAVAVCRYIKRYLPNSYDLTKSERDTYLAAGLGVAYNAEQAAGDFLTKGSAWWRDYGAYCRARLLSWGVPTGAGIAVIASCDQGVTATQIPTVVANYAAFKAGLGTGFEVRAYAGMPVIEALVRANVVPATSRHWLPGARSWSGNYPNFTAYAAAMHAHSLAGLVQEVGSDIAGTDRNQIVELSGLGIHWPAGHALAGSGSLITSEDDLPFTARELAQIVNDAVIGVLRGTEAHNIIGGATWSAAMPARNGLPAASASTYLTDVRDLAGRAFNAATAATAAATAAQTPSPEALAKIAATVKALVGTGGTTVVNGGDPLDDEAVARIVAALAAMLARTPITLGGSAA